MPDKEMTISAGELALLRLAILSEKREGPHLLSSGKMSDVYFNLRPITIDPARNNTITKLILGLLDGVDFNGIGGPAVGAIPLIMGTALRLHQKGIMVTTFYTRDDSKKQQKFEGHLWKNSKVVLLDDVTTTGGSLITVAKKVRQRGSSVVLAISILDREEGAVENLKLNGITLYSFFKKSDFDR